MGGVLVFGSQQNAVAGLAEPSPAVFHQVRLDQHANRILEFQVVLDHERMPVSSANERSVAWHPLPRLPEVIELDGDVGRVMVAGPPPNMMASAEASRKLSCDLEGTILRDPDTSGNRVRVRTLTRSSGAVKSLK